MTDRAGRLSGHRVAAFVLAVMALLPNPVSGAGTAAEPVRIYVAASLIDAAEALTEAFGDFHGKSVVVPGASSTLARQIANGAPADVFMSANREWIDWLIARRKIVPGSPRAVAGNALVVVTGPDGGARPETRRAVGADTAAQVLRAAAAGRIALGDPDHVPVGRYARAVISAAGFWREIEPAVVPTADTRAALRLVARGAVAAAIVYRSDALAADVRIVGQLPQPDPPIAYHVALVAGRPSGENPRAAEFMAFLMSADAAQVFCRAGFRPYSGAAPSCGATP